MTIHEDMERQLLYDPTATNIDKTEEEWAATLAHFERMGTRSYRIKGAIIWYLCAAFAVLLLVAMILGGLALGEPVFNPGKPTP